jgi:hypothetical protein
MGQSGFTNPAKGKRGDCNTELSCSQVSIESVKGVLKSLRVPPSGGGKLGNTAATNGNERKLSGNEKTVSSNKKKYS